ncbi:hypothetical protein AVEN_151555-1 [Araneus ventricosus]|uniref:Uncharacterized protein n=1 Tax=Araneus ventricosus TaxID=182803 RepID=A0A4Y2U2N8_ARAVE|nr:hypothetical protein AVEN_151555-1 [Araneus ventricosus]
MFRFRRAWGLLHAKSYVVAKRPLVGVAWTLGEGCQLSCRPRHLTVVQNDEVVKLKLNIYLHFALSNLNNMYWIQRHLAINLSPSQLRAPPGQKPVVREEAENFRDVLLHGK